MKDRVCNIKKEVLPHKIKKDTFKLLKKTIWLERDKLYIHERRDYW